MQNEMSLAAQDLESGSENFGVPTRVGMDRVEEHDDWPLLSRIPIQLTCSVPLRFKVSDLLELRTGRMILSEWTSTDDVPLKIGAVQLSWSEFEVVEQRMAVRLTRLA